MYTYTHIGLFLLFFLCTVTGLFCRCFPLPSLAVTALVFNFLQIVRVRVCVCVRGRYRMLPPIVRGYCVKWGGDSLILVGCCCWGRGGGCSSCGHCACVPPSRASLMSAAVVTTATEKGMVEGLQTGVGHVCGPAVHRVAARQSLMGLWGHGCARPRGNSIHTRVYIRGGEKNTGLTQWSLGLRCNFHIGKLPCNVSLLLYLIVFFLVILSSWLCPLILFFTPCMCVYIYVYIHI